MKKLFTAVAVAATLFAGVTAVGTASATTTPEAASPQASAPASQTPTYTAAELTGRAAFAPDAATKAAALATPGQCTGSWIAVTSNDLITFRSSPDATVNNGMFQVVASSGALFPCRKLVAAGRYNACGHTNANGWILVQDYMNLAQKQELGWSAYVPSVCVGDHS
jgi:uncharacterized low-complexity protein